MEQTVVDAWGGPADVFKDNGPGHMVIDPMPGQKAWGRARGRP